MNKWLLLFFFVGSINSFAEESKSLSCSKNGTELDVDMRLVNY